MPIHEEQGKYGLIIRIQQCECLDDVRVILEELTNLYGFSAYGVYTVPVSKKIRVSDCVYLSSIPPDFFLRFDRIVQSPLNFVYHRLANILGPAQWHLDEIIRRSEAKDAQGLRELYRSHGYTISVDFPMRNVSGARRLMSFVGSREFLPAFEFEALNFYAVQILGKIMELESEQTIIACHFTHLELQCLQSLAYGEEAVSIAAKLGLSARTVQFLAASACKKLQVGSIDHAVAKALRLGIIR